MNRLPMTAVMIVLAVASAGCSRYRALPGGAPSEVTTIGVNS